MFLVLVSITVVDSVELLDGVSTALRSIAQKLAEGNPVQVHNVRLLIYRSIVGVIFQVICGFGVILSNMLIKVKMCMSIQLNEVTESDLQVLFEMGLKCNVNQIRANAVSIISTIGTSLAKQSSPHQLLQVSKLL